MLARERTLFGRCSCFFDWHWKLPETTLNALSDCGFCLRNARLRTPSGYPCIDQILSLGYDHPEDGKDNEYCENLFGFENLPRKIESRSQPELTHHHFSRDNQNDGNTEAEAHTRKNRWHCRGQQNHFDDLTVRCSEVSRCKH